MYSIQFFQFATIIPVANVSLNFVFLFHFLLYLGGPIYSKANGNELWVMLIEKAFAKYCGSYAAICAGKPFEALIDITGTV